MKRGLMFVAGAAALACAAVVLAQSAEAPGDGLSDASARLGEGERVLGARLSNGSGQAMAIRKGGFAGERGVCPEERIQYYTDKETPVSVPGFNIDEECAVVFEAPADHYPIEILRVGIGWSSVAGGQPDTLEDAILIYPNGLPNPGAFQYEALGPVLQDGGINEFDLSVQGSGSRIINSGEFTVSLRILTPQSGSASDPAPIHDGDGCQPGRNAIFDSTVLQWFDACNLGLSGDWIFYVIYEQVDCTQQKPTDCNGNGVDDSDEIDAFPSLDCDGDGALDTCQIEDDPSLDCNGNNQLDSCEIADDPSLDCDGNGELDSCQIAAEPTLDANMNGVLDSCEEPGACPADLTGNGVVNAADLAELLTNWGECP